MQINRFEEQYRTMRVGVLMGGTSSEREVSLTSGTGIANALKETGFNILRIDLTRNALPDDALSCDVLFPALHGGFGEDGGIQELLDNAGLAYVGSQAAASRLCMDKTATKDALQKAGLPVPGGQVFLSPEDALATDLPLPLVVKPNSGGSSVALFIIDNRTDYEAAVEKAFAHEQEILVEQFIDATEFTVAVLDGKALMPVEIVPPNGVYDYDAKYVYNQGKTQYFCPPQSIDDETIQKMQKIAEQAWAVLGNRDLVRIDILLDKSGIPFVLEANTLPGFTPTSLMPKAAANAGISYPELCTHLVLSAFNRKQQ